MNRKRKNTYRSLCLVFSIWFVLNVSLFAFIPETRIAAASVASNPFEAAIEKAVRETIQEQVPILTPQVEQIVLSEVQVTITQVRETVMQTQAKINIQSGPMDFSQLPPAEVIAQIPPQFREQAAGTARERAQASIEAEFALAVPAAHEQIKMAMEECIPQIQDQVRASIQTVIPKVSTLIETNLDQNISAKVLTILPEITPLIPAEMAGMTPQQIAEQMKAKFKPEMEPLVRIPMETIIKAKAKDFVETNLEIPLKEKMDAQMKSQQDALIESNLAQMPPYLESLVPKSFISSVIQNEINKLSAQIPIMVAENNSLLKQKMDDFVNAEINSGTKVYLGNNKINFDVQPQVVNNRLLVPFRAIAESLDAQVQYIPETRQVDLKKDGKNIVLTLDSNKMLVNGQPVTIDVAPAVIGSRTMVPVRFIAQSLGVQVDYQPDWQIVSLKQ